MLMVECFLLILFDDDSGPRFSHVALPAPCSEIGANPFREGRICEICRTSSRAGKSCGRPVQIQGTARRTGGYAKDQPFFFTSTSPDKHVAAIRGNEQKLQMLQQENEQLKAAIMEKAINVESGLHEIASLREKLALAEQQKGKVESSLTAEKQLLV